MGGMLGGWSLWLVECFVRGKPVGRRLGGASARWVEFLVEGARGGPSSQRVDFMVGGVG